MVKNTVIVPILSAIFIVLCVILANFLTGRPEGGSLLPPYPVFPIPVDL